MNAPSTAQNATETPAYLLMLRQLVRCTQAFERFSGAHVRSMGLTESQFDVVATLGNTVGMSCKELGERTLITKGTLTGVLDRMTARGLLARKIDPIDARRTHVNLTRKGQALFNEVFPDHIAHLRRAFDRVPDDDLNMLRDGLIRLRAAFEEEHAR
jgi:MarR family transcriptional regulator, 2-MHQ and catechol-resistance regulon repressor